MIRILLIFDSFTARRRLARLLNAQPGIVVVGEIDVDGPVAERSARVRPHVALFDTTCMVGQILPIADEVRRAVPGCRLVVLSNPALPGTLPPRRHAAQLSFLLIDTSPPSMAAWLRRIVGGERIVDPQLEIALLRMDKTVNTRELEILGLAAQGDSVADIARRLCLSLGTVRNYISAAILKTGARNRLDAIRIVRRDGWLR